VHMSVTFRSTALRLKFVSSGGMGENEAYLDRNRARSIGIPSFGDNGEECPTRSTTRNHSIPDKRELDRASLGLGFAAVVPTTTTTKFATILIRTGTYSRYKDVWCGGAPSTWYDFSTSREATLRSGCAENGSTSADRAHTVHLPLALKKGAGYVGIRSNSIGRDRKRE